jgi:uncharacterized OsmC-like protein
VGEVETEDKVLILRRIHVRLRLQAPKSQREAAERVHEFFAERCPVYRSIRDAIHVTTELAFEAS